MGIVSYFITTVTDIVQNTSASNAAALAQAISPVFFAAIGVYIIFIAYEIIYAHKEVIMSEVTKMIMVFTLIGAFTYTAPYYADYVIPFVMSSGTELSAAITGTEDVATSIDNLWDSLSTTYNNYLETNLAKLGKWEFGGIVVTYTVWAVGYLGASILILYTALYLTISIFMVGILLSVGTLFICFSLFPSTRNMFTAWCGSCLNYILLNVFYTVSFGFVLGLIRSQTTDNPSMITIQMNVMQLIFILISVFLIEQIGTLCSTLTGGVGINGLTSAANGMAGKLASAGKAMGGPAAKLASQAANSAKSMSSKVASKMERLGKNTIGG